MIFYTQNVGTMEENQTSYFNTVVKKLKKYRGKVITIQNIKNIVHSIIDDTYSDKKAYKIVYYLKTKGYIQSIKKDMLLCKYPEDTFSDDAIIEKYYRGSTKKHCKESCGTQRYI